jgi:ABC-type nitrate/sulfonate/bicarbonate transport system permease component
MKFKNIANFWSSTILVFLIFISWEIFAERSLINERLLPKPSSVIKGLISNWDIIAPHVHQTALEAIIGLTAAIVLGIIAALFLNLNSRIRQAISPLLVASQNIPMIALAPLLLVWFGFGFMPKAIMVVLFCFFPIAISTASGLAATDPEEIKLLKSMNANEIQILKFARIPGALPQFFSGLKIAATYSITAAIVGEYVGAEKGLGIYMKTAGNSHATVLVFAAIFVTVILSLLLFGLVAVVEKIATPWNQKE